MSKEMNDKHNNRLKEAEQHYRNRITKGLLILITGMVMVIAATLCVVLF